MFGSPELQVTEPSGTFAWQRPDFLFRPLGPGVSDGAQESCGISAEHLLAVFLRCGFHVPGGKVPAVARVSLSYQDLELINLLNSTRTSSKVFKHVRAFIFSIYKRAHVSEKTVLKVRNGT